MTIFLVAGYKNADLGIFNSSDSRLKIIKKAIKKDLENLLEEGCQWLVFTGTLGFEYWVLEVAQGLRKEGYQFQMGVIFPFEDYGHHWNEANQVKLAAFKQLDFVKYSYPSYQNPAQLRSHQEFLLEHTQGAYLFYDDEHETKLKYLFTQMKDMKDYDIKRLTFDRLNELAEDF